LPQGLPAAGAAARVRFSPPRCVFASTVTGAVAAPGVVAHADDWRRQAGEPVRFQQALEALRGAGFDTSWNWGGNRR